MKIHSFMYKVDIVIAGLIIGLTWSPAVASAADITSSTTSSTTTTAPATTPSSTEAAHLSLIISKGNAEIQRRLDNLSTLQSLINSASKLSTSDKTVLLNEVSSTVSGLKQLNTQLDSATTLLEARTDVQNIITEYRVYVLVVPKVHLIKIADDQLVIEDKLTALAQKLQTRITEADKTGQNVTTLLSELTSMNSLETAAQAISSSIDSSVINLQPSDYNTDQSVLEGDIAQLQKAHSDNENAFLNAKQIISALEAMKTANTSTPTSQPAKTAN